MAKYFFGELLSFQWENLGENSWNAKLRFVAGLPRHKRLDNDQFNPIRDRKTCHVSRCQAYEFTCIFRTSLCDVTGYASV